MARLDQRPVRLASQAFRDVRSLYLSAFPPNERQPYPLLWLFSQQPAIRLTAYYDAGHFAGFSYVVETEAVTFVFLLAVAADQRSQGYGSQILAEIATTSPGKVQLLCIEPMDPAADNYDQRLKRLAFYERNGYRRQYRYFYEQAETYEILATAGEIDYDQLARALNRVSLCLLGIRISQKFE